MRKNKDDKMVDLTKTWHLVYASGPMSKYLSNNATTPPLTQDKP